MYLKTILQSISYTAVGTCDIDNAVRILLALLRWTLKNAEFFAAVFTAITAIAAWKSATQNKMLVEAGVRPVLGFKEAVALPPENSCYPVHLYFTNHGKGAAWVLETHCWEKESRKQLGAHVSTPVCIGPGETTGGIKIWLPQENQQFQVLLDVYYWSIHESAHCTKLDAVLSWKPVVNPIAEIFINSERIIHDIKRTRPEKVQHCDCQNTPITNSNCHHRKWKRILHIFGLKKS